MSSAGFLFSSRREFEKGKIKYFLNEGKSQGGLLRIYGSGCEMVPQRRPPATLHALGHSPHHPPYLFLENADFSFWSYGSKKEHCSHMAFRSVLSYRSDCDGGNITCPVHCGRQEPLHMWNVTSATEDLNFKFYLILIYLNLSLNNFMGLVATVLDSVVWDCL